MPTARLRAGPDEQVVEYLLGLSEEELARGIDWLGEDQVVSLHHGWREWAHEGQRPPDGDWRTWVMMAGRGFGKTYAGAHWVADAMRADGRLRVALVAATLDEARAVMVKGRSGLLEAGGCAVADWTFGRRTLKFANGAEATLFSGASPEKLRGPEHHIAWCDELAKWERPQEAWDMLQLGLRLGDRPRALVTTTPRPGPVLRRIMAEPGCVRTGGRTADNPHLSRAYQATVERLYRGTRLGPQELDGVLLPDGGALWTPEVLERCRVWPAEAEPTPPFVSSEVEKRPPARSSDRFLDYARNERGGDGEVEEGEPGRFARTLIGVDPPSGEGTCGIVACALDGDGVGHVLADHSVADRSPEGWAGAVADAVAVHRAAAVVAERNQGGRMVEAVLRAAGLRAPIRLVHASDGKAARAEPVALLFEAGRVRLHGRLPELEAELLGFVAGARYQGPGASPDRADAMVWALTELMLGRAGEPRVRVM